MKTDHAAAALALFGAGCNCAQAVLCAFAKELGMPEETAIRLATGFGAGMGRTSGACGAVTGACLVLGLARGMRRPQDQEAKESTYALVQEFSRLFRETHGTVNCTELLGVDIGTREGMASARERNLFATRCNEYVRDAVLIVEDLITDD